MLLFLFSIVTTAAGVTFFCFFRGDLAAVADLFVLSGMLLDFLLGLDLTNACCLGHFFPATQGPISGTAAALAGGAAVCGLTSLAGLIEQPPNLS